MTNREFFEKVIATSNDSEIIAFAQLGIEKLDKANAQKKLATDKHKAENEIIKANMIEYMQQVKEILIANDFVGKVEGVCSTSKASALLKQLVENGVVSKMEIKRDTRKTSGYKLV